MATHYEILGIDTDADRSAVKKAYFRLCRTYHPDVSGDANGHFFKLVTAAYETLSDESLRARYDSALNDSNNGDYASSAHEPDEDNTPYSRAEPHSSEGLVLRSSVDFERMDWFKTDYTQIKEKVVLRHPHMFLALASTAVFFIGIIATGCLALTTSPPFPVILFLGLLAAAIFTQNSFSRFRMSQAVFMAVMAVWVGGHIWDISNDIQKSAFQPVVLGVAISTAAFGCLGLYAGRKWRKWSIVKKDRGRMVLSAKDAKTYAIWGSPGKSSDAIDKFGQRNSTVGAVAERRTAELLSQLLLIPGTKIFHGLKVPDSDDTDVDHAVVNGNKIAFIDSKMWSGGHYSWANNGTIVRDKKYDSLELYTRFPEAIDKMDATLFHEAESRGWILVHSSDNRPVVTANVKLGAVRLGSPQECLEEVGAWFTQDETGTINRGILNSILHKVK